MEDDVRLSVVIPVYNSEKTIGTVVEKIKTIFGKKINFEIILIDDHSTDNSYKVCKKLAENNSFVKVIRFSKNFGQSAAILTGFRFARGEYVASMDDDLQTPPEGLSELLNEIEKDYDVVFANYSSHEENLVRKFFSKVNDRLARILINKPSDVYLSSIFMVRSYVAREMSKYQGPFPYAVGLIFGITQNYSTVIVEHEEREEGVSGYNFWKLINLAINGYTNYSIKPLRISIILGSLISFVGFMYALFLIYQKIVTPTVPVGYTSLISAILFIGGLNLLMIGMVGEYVGRTFLSINRQPQSVIRETINVQENGYTVQ